MKVFISYSHKDEKWKDELENFLKLYEKNRTIEVWSDRKLKTGEYWKKKIFESIEKCDIAVLLITNNFLISDFITDKEIPHLLEQRKRNDFQFFPIIVSSCNWQEIDWLAEQQIQPKDGKPLDKFDDINEQLAELTKTIKDLNPLSLKSQIIKVFNSNLKYKKLTVNKLKELCYSVLPEPHQYSLPKCNENDIESSLLILIDWLSNMRKNSNSNLPIIEFITKIIPFLKDETSTNKVNNLLKKIEETFGYSSKKTDNVSSEKKKSSKCYLLIKIDQDKKKPKRYRIIAWYYKNKNIITTLPKDSYDSNNLAYKKRWFKFFKRKEFLDLENNTYSLENLPLVVHKLLMNIYENCDFHGSSEELGIEFFLPLNLIDLKVDSWNIKKNIYDPIASRYQTVVRLKDRYEGNINDREDFVLPFRERWNSKVFNSSAQNAVLWLEKPELEGIRSGFSKGKLFIGLSFIPEKDFLSDLLKDLGTPFILWPRKIDGIDDIKDLKEKLTSCKCVGEIPSIVTKERLEYVDESSQESIIHHISLLWDDWRRPMPKIHYKKNVKQL